MLDKLRNVAAKAKKEMNQTVRDGNLHTTFNTHHSRFYDYFRDVIHGDMLPDNFTYDTTYEALTAIEEGLSDEYCLGIEPDIYNADLLRWSTSDSGRWGRAEEVLDESYDSGARLGLFDILREAQGREIEEITQAVLAYIEQEAESEGESDAEGEDDYEL